VRGRRCRRQHIALHEVGAPFAAKPLSFATRETRSPEFLAVNPEGKVPTLVVEGRALTEVAAILFYLARRFPAAGLLPVDNLEAEAQGDFLDVFHCRDPSSRPSARHRARTHGVCGS
jgi:glutathione S-transferase